MKTKMKMAMVILSAGLTHTVAFADVHPDQCLLVRDDQSRYELEVPQEIPIRTKEGWKTFETPKKVKPTKFRQIRLTEERSYKANIKLRKQTTGEIISVSVDTRAFVKGEGTQEATYYGSEVLPLFYVKANGLHIVVRGNKFMDGTGSHELHIAPCSKTEIFAFHGPEAIVDSQEAPEYRGPVVLQ